MVEVLKRLLNCFKRKPSELEEYLLQQCRMQKIKLYCMNLRIESLEKNTKALEDQLDESIQTMHLYMKYSEIKG